MSDNDTTRETAPQGLLPSDRGWLKPALVIGLAVLFAALPLLAVVSAVTVCAPLLVGLVTAGGGWWLHRLRSASQQDAPDQASRSLSSPPSLDALLQGVLPVWHQHLVATRTQIDAAANALLGSFVSISDQFEAAGFKGSGGVHAEQADTAQRLMVCETDLQQVIALMNELMDAKERMNASMKELGSATKDLQSMAQGVAQIAAQTNLLAINAAIEAAHAGDSGRGFSTIAKEIRSLSQSSAETASEISARIDRVTDIMDGTSHAVEKAAEHEGAAIERSKSSVAGVLETMRQLSAEAEGMRERGNVIRGDIEQLIISLQFQDRVNQQMCVVEGDLTRLRDLLEQHEALPEVDRWLADLQQTYTMREQRQVNLGESANGSPAARKAVFF